MPRPRSFLRKTFLSLVIIGLLLAVSYRLWLPLFGRILVHDEGPAKADVALVLGGDTWGNRVEFAAGLVRQGYVPKVLISGPPGFYGMYESDMALSFAIRRGYPAEWFEGLPHHALNTRDEARAILPELKRRGIRSVLVITSNFHTARARRTFLHVEESTGGGPTLRFVAAPDEFFQPDKWWKNRESQKTTFFEWSKTIASALGY